MHPFGVAQEGRQQHHHLDDAVADRGLILNHSRVVLDSSAADLLAHRDQVEAAYFGVEEFGDVEREALPS